MEIALINHDYPPYIFGGVGTFMHEIAKGLTRKNVDVHVITGYNEPLYTFGNFTKQRYSEDKIDVFRLPYPNIPPRHTLFQLWNFKKIIEHINRLNLDVIHGQCTATYPLLPYLKKKSPVLTTFHMSPMMEKIGSVQSIFRGGTFRDLWTFLIGYPSYHTVFLKELQLSDTVVTVSKSLKNEILAEMGSKYADKIESIHNGIDLESLDTEYREIEDETLESENTILFAGRLFWRKGALTLIKLAYLLQRRKTNFKIIVHGTGPLFKRMQEYIGFLHLENIELKGFTSKPALLKSMRQSKFIVVPSSYEACPMILLEGMCLGKIPLMFRLPFSIELTEDGKYGILGDGSLDLVNRLVELKNTRSIEEFSNRVRAYSRKMYNVEKTADQYIRLYRNLSS